MTATSIHQPNLLPWLGYFKKIGLSDTFIILDDVYPSIGGSSYINRTMLSTEKFQKWHTIPLKSSERGSKKISEMKSLKNNEGTRLVNVLDNYYSKCDFGQELLNWISTYEDLYNENFIEANISVIKDFSELIKFDTKIIRASNLELTSGDKSEHLVNLLKRSNSSKYLCGSGSLNYLNNNLFKINQIEVEVIRFEALNVLENKIIFSNSFVSVWAKYGIKELQRILAEGNN